MIHFLTKIRKNLRSFGQWLEPAWPANSFASLCYVWLFFVIVSFARVGLAVIGFLVELPVHALLSPMQGFQMLARRGPGFEFLDSYAAHMRRYRMAVATIIVSILTLVVQTYFLGSLIFQTGHPQSAFAFSTSIVISPSWDADAFKSDKYIDDGFGTCIIQITNYSISNTSATQLNWGLDDQLDQNAGDCSVARFNRDYRSALKFSLSSVPGGATITKVELLSTVNTARTGSVKFVHISGDSPDGLTAQNLYDGIPTIGTYVSVSNWSTTGLKTVDLGSTAVTDAQSRIGSNFAVGINASLAVNQQGQIASQDNATSSSRPQLRVTYTLPPQAPTGTGHSSISTSTIGWTWTDNATAETRYDVEDGSHAPVTGCTNLAANTASCTETGLSANTQYTRHPNVTDANGNTDGPSASAYTSIESPAGLNFSAVSTTSITAASSTTLSNLAVASSGVYFQENNTSTNSGWLTTNSWTKSSLTANTQYAFQVKARNGDAVETSLLSAQNKYTLPLAPNVTTGRSASTWYTSGTFDFSNAAAWGGGGVQYYRYVWDTSSTHSFTGSESTWSDNNAKCPGGTCTTANTTLANTASSDSNSWYLHVQSFNGEDAANGSGTNYGPYYFDGTNPTSVGTVTDDGAYATSTSQLHASWGTATDVTSGLQKYQYAIGTSAGATDVVTYTDNGTTTSVTKTGLSLAESSTYYVSVRAVDTAGNTGSIVSSNGIIIDSVNPSAPTSVNDGTGADVAYTTSTTQLSANWTASTDSTSGIQKYQYAIGTTSGGTDVVGYTDNSSTTSVTKTGLSLTNGATYFTSVRAVDNAGNAGSSASSNGIIVNTSLPSITDNQTGDATPRNAGGATYNVDFTKASTGPQLDYAQYAVYAGPNTTGTLIKNWTDIFTTDTNAYTTDWPVDFSALPEGKSYVSVRVFGLDALSNELDDAFTITKDTVAPTFSGLSAGATSSGAAITWTTNEPATSQIDYGVSTAYGTTTTQDASLVTSHSVTITGLTAATTYHVRANSIDQAGNIGSSTDLSFTTDAVSTPMAVSIPPAANPTETNSLATPTMTSLTDGQTTADPKPLIAGTGPKGVGIYIIIDGQLAQTVPTNPDGLYSTRLLTAVSLGSHTVTVRARDAQGNTSAESASIGFTRILGSIALTVVRTQVSDGPHPSVTYYFVAPGNATVKIFLDEKVIGQKTIAAGATAIGTAMSVTLPTSLSLGTHQIYIESFDANEKGSVPKGYLNFTHRAAASTAPVLQTKTPTTYIVQTGDSLWSIARHIMGRGTNSSALINANHAQFPQLSLQHPRIFPGQILVIPST